MADLPAVLSQLEEPAQRTVAVRELVFSNALSVENAQAIQDTVEIEPILQAILYSVDRTLETESTVKALEELTNNTEIPLFARGVAASELAERGEEAPLQAWMNEVNALPENARSRVLYELTLLTNQLDSPITANVILKSTSNLPPDDLLRVAATSACLRMTPETGIPAWRDLMEAVDTIPLRSALVMIVLEVGAEVPRDALEPLNDGPPFHKMLLTLLETPPESRLEGSLDVIQHGHLPSMQWAMMEASSEVERPDSIAVFNAILNKALTNPRPAYLELASKAAKILATIDPQSIAARIAMTDSPIMKEILFSALA
ncbi:MAG: hypothetical protein VX528_02160, partial [Candidatus Latescibacterota bacterium]|nr:hypothetical protein [Candidatus Latescibacterota bacterium]